MHAEQIFKNFAFFLIKLFVSLPTNERPTYTSDIQYY